jgi:spiro-SPASM protein
MLRPALVDRLASAKTYPGRLLNYLPESPMRDPISGEGCVPTATAVARTTRNFRLDSDRQINLLSSASIHLNGELVGSDSEDLLQRLDWTAGPDWFPREVVLELNTLRATNSIFAPTKVAEASRAPIGSDLTAEMFNQLASSDDVRITLSGVGDPLLHPQLFEILEQAHNSDLGAIHIETDLLPSDPSYIERLVESQIDVVSVHLPAMSGSTYAAVMGVDRFNEVIENIQKFVIARQKHGTGLPLLVPIFTKCQQNLAEMETWYDQWLKALGSVIVREPSTFGGLIPDCGVADMSPPKRKPCARIASRMTILSNGLVASCEQDVLARQVLGDLTSSSIEQVWKDGFTDLRKSHLTGCLADRPVCTGCREWHRP